jgi:outer membrane cobalamin receptor
VSVELWLKTSAILISAAAATCLVAEAASAQLEEFTGRPIVDLIEALRDQGTRIVYRADALPTRLRVTVEPASSDTFEGLREILAPHGLDVELGPRDTWLIVRRDRPAVPQTTESANRPSLELIPPSLETVIVTASRYPIERESTTSTSTIGRSSIETTPALGQDPLRITHRLPGVESDQLTSRMHVRGGSLDEVLLTLDGVELYSPYHLRDFQSVFSSIDPRIIESMDVRTGGYEAKFGGKMSGVIDMQTITPTDFRHHEVAVSLLSTSILSSGLFNNGSGSWTTSVRRGNLDVLAKSFNSKYGTPQYVDAFSKIQFSPLPSTRVAASLLSLNDNVSLRFEPESRASADDSDTYFWVSVDRSAPSGLEARYRVSTTHLNRTRAGDVDEADKVSGRLFDGSKFDRRTVTADWAIGIAQRLRIGWGAELAQLELDHRLDSARTDAVAIDVPDLTGPVIPPTAAGLELTQQQHSVYASFRFQPVARLVTELGLRWDEQSLTNQSQTNPRFNLLFDITGRTSLRAAWGEFSQPDSLSDLAVADGLLTLQSAEEARHSILGLDHRFGESGLFRVEVYQKTYEDLNRRFENVFERVSLLPELLPDRFAVDPSNATTRGVELSIEGARDRFAWWANLALARTKERLANGWFMRSWDQRRSVKAGGEWSGQKWVVTTNLAYRSGWPISNLLVVNGSLLADDYNAVRLPDFSSADIRASRSVDVARGAVNWYIEISNLFDHPNYCCLSYEAGTMPDVVLTEYDELLGRVPNLGVRWQF